MAVQVTLFDEYLQIRESITIREILWIVLVRSICVHLTNPVPPLLVFAPRLENLFNLNQ